jgi:hypothetical protein
MCALAVAGAGLAAGWAGSGSPAGADGTSSLQPERLGDPDALVATPAGGDGATVGGATVGGGRASGSDSIAGPFPTAVHGVQPAVLGDIDRGHAVAAGGAPGPVATQSTPESGVHRSTRTVGRHRTGAGDPPELGETTLSVQVRSNGDARWNVSAVADLDGANGTAAFAALGDAFEGGGDPGLGLETFRQAAAAASTATERRMTIESVNRSTVVGNDTGRLVLEFTWTKFADQQGNRLVVGDAFETPNGTWLPGLAANQTLLLRSPADSAIVSAPVGPDDEVLRWTGPLAFPPGSPSAIYELERRRRGTPPQMGDEPNVSVAGSNGTAAGTAGPGQSADPTVSPVPGASPFGLAVLGLVAVGLAALLAYTYSRRGSALGTDGLLGEAGVSEVDVSDSRETAGPPESDVGGSAAGADAAPTGVDDALLSDAERVERLLADRDGRMRQARIVEATEWSNAKVSGLLSEMADDGRIEKLRIGRENLISLPEEAESGDHGEGANHVSGTDRGSSADRRD